MPGPVGANQAIRDQHGVDPDVGIKRGIVCTAEPSHFQVWRFWPIDPEAMDHLLAV